MTDSTHTPDHAALWRAFAEGDDAAREALLVEHLSLVHHVARQLGRTLSTRTDFDELVSAGTIGLMEALAGFDPARGLAFSTFAVPRIRGAILDELRRLDYVPRSVRRKTRDIAGARQALTQTLGRTPEDRELAERVHVAVTTAAPELSPKTWYGMPAYANADGKVVLFFQDSGKFNYRYSTLGFQDAANLDDGDLWPVSYALRKWSPVVENQVAKLVKAAVS